MTTAAVRSRLADAAGILDDLGGMMEGGADRLPPLVLARALVRLDGIGRRLVRLRRAVADALDDERRAGSPGSTPQTTP